jgi:hypothetical protein
MNYNGTLSDNEKAIENSIKDENDNLIGRISSNIREFTNLNMNLNTKINSTNDYAEKLHDKFDKSKKGIKGNINHLASVVKYKQGKICWFIVLVFILVFFIRRYYRYNSEITISE